MKYIGVLLIVATGLGFGMIYTRRLRSRANYLWRVERLLEAMGDRLLYSAQPLTTLWQSLAADTVLSAYPLVQDTANELCKGKDFYTAFSRAIGIAEADGRLNPTEAGLLTELGGALGRSGLDQQAELIRHCAERLGQERHTAQTLASERGRLYPMLGLAGGVSLALLLM